MRRALACLTLPVGAFALPTLALAAPGETSTASGTVSATVVKPLVLEPQSDLSFGAVTLEARGAGSVTVGAVPGAISHGGAARPICHGAAACDPHPARFFLRGEAGRDYQVQLPPTLTAFGGKPGSPSLQVESLTVATDSMAGAGPRGRLAPDGSDEFGIGGTVVMPAGTPPDTYRANVTVLVTYI
ncbi:DUF4402 domain-containing protein [Altererythrobacter sp. CAU 1778]